jgi:replicative DNA helicase
MEKKKTVKDIHNMLVAKNHKEITKYKVTNEASVVGALWKNPELYSQHKINSNHFGMEEESNMWRVYFVIGKEIVQKGKNNITEVEVDLYLDQHPKMKKVYESAGGYDTISELMTEYASEENIDGYIQEFHKWWAISELNKKGWVEFENIKEFIDYSIDDIYRTYSVPLHDIFIHTTSNIKTYNLCSDLDSLIDRANRGLIRGIPLHNADILDKMIGGVRKGEIVMMGGISGSGKTTTMIEILLPTIIELDKQIVLMLNEQDEDKVRREMLTWIMNNIYDANFNKSRWVQGEFTEDEMNHLNTAKSWLQEKEDRKNVTIIPIEKYSADLVVKIINKYAGMGVEYFCLDTFKPSTDADSALQWQEMTRDSVKIYDAIKPATNNVGMWINLQLAKSVSKHRYLGLDSIGVAKNVVDVASTFIALRSLWNIEKSGGRKATEYIKYQSENSKTTIKKVVDSEDHVNHSILFVPKSREGAGGFQVMSKNNLGLNKFEELGILYLEEDF